MESRNGELFLQGVFAILITKVLIKEKSKDEKCFLLKRFLGVIYGRKTVSVKVINLKHEYLWVICLRMLRTC